MKILRKISRLLRRDRLDVEMTEEMRLHVEFQTERNLASGMGANEARLAAQRQFGNVGVIQQVAREHLEHETARRIAQGEDPVTARRHAAIAFGHVDSLKEQVRDGRFARGGDDFFRNLRHAIRALGKAPGFTVVAVATVAVCMGANLSIFAVVDAILLRPLPLPDADRLVTMYNTYPGANVDRDESSITNFFERRGAIDAFVSLALFTRDSAIVGETGATTRENIMRVSPEFFATLGVAPTMGRAFTEAETTWQTEGVAILTDSFWQERFNADPAVLGRTMIVDGLKRTVVGILPPGFRFLSADPGFFVPFASSPEQHEAKQRHAGGYTTIARLHPGVTLEQAQAQIDAHNLEVERDNPSPDAAVLEGTGFRTVVVSLHADHVAAVRPMLWLLQAGALFLLLIGAVNLINLFLIRASGRTRELAVRQALGASRRHVAWAVMTETVLLTSAGAMLGLAVGAAGIQALSVVGADRLPLATRIAFDERLGMVAVLGALLLGGLIGGPITWFNVSGRLATTLRLGARHSTADRSTHRMRQGFIVAQIALAFVLLAGAGLLAVSLQRAMEVSPGFRSDHVLTARLSLPGKSYGNIEARLDFFSRLVASLEQQPGMLAAGVATNVPLSGINNKSAAKPELVNRDVSAPPRASYSCGVTGNYFAALGFSLVEGRFLTADDSARPERFCVVDADFARVHWPEGHAIGRRLFQGSQQRDASEAFTVVGVVAPVKQADLTENAAIGAVYYPYRWRSNDTFFVALRTSLDPASVGPTLRTVVRTLDPNLPLDDLRTMETRIADSLATRRSPAMLAGLFSAVALLLAGLGLYGVMAYSVAQRTREFGLRMALGAQQRQVMGFVFRQGVRLIVLGLVIGVVGTLLVTHAMQSLLYEVSPGDPLTLAAGAGLLALVAALACLLPARRATKVDPIIALRSE